MVSPPEGSFKTNTDVFAEKVVREIERGTKGKVWLGGYSTLARVFGWLLPVWVCVSLSTSHSPFKLGADDCRRWCLLTGGQGNRSCFFLFFFMFWFVCFEVIADLSSCLKGYLPPYENTRRVRGPSGVEEGSVI